MGGEHLIPLKKPRSYEEQITLLRNKNLLIKDEEFAKQILIQTGYYRLSGYYYFFYENPKTSKNLLMELLLKIFIICIDLIRS